MPPRAAPGALGTRSTGVGCGVEMLFCAPLGLWSPPHCPGVGGQAGLGSILLMQHPLVPSMQHPLVPSMQHPLVPSMQHPLVPSIQHPLVPSMQRLVHSY